MSSINGNYNLKNINLIKPFVQSCEVIFLNEDNIIKHFNENTLALDFKLFKKKGAVIDFNNNIFTSSINKLKIVFELNLFYRWLDVEYPPRFNLDIIKNDVLYVTRALGLTDSSDTNNVFLSIIIDIENMDKINFILRNDFDKNKYIEFFDNSFYVLKIF